MDKEWYLVIPKDGSEAFMREGSSDGAKDGDRIIYIESLERPYVCELRGGELEEVPMKFD